MVNNECIQKYDPQDHEMCGNGKHCRHCGWNENICRTRNQYIAEHGLTMCKDGIERLIIPSSPV